MGIYIDENEVRHDTHHKDKLYYTLESPTHTRDFEFIIGGNVSRSYWGGTCKQSEIESIGRI